MHLLFRCSAISSSNQSEKIALIKLLIIGVDTERSLDIIFQIAIIWLWKKVFYDTTVISVGRYLDCWNKSLELYDAAVDSVLKPLLAFLEATLLVSKTVGVKSLKWPLEVTSPLAPCTVPELCGMLPCDLATPQHTPPPLPPPTSSPPHSLLEVVTSLHPSHPPWLLRGRVLIAKYLSCLRTFLSIFFFFAFFWSSPKVILC